MIPTSTPGWVSLTSPTKEMATSSQRCRSDTVASGVGLMNDGTPTELAEFEVHLMVVAHEVLPWYETPVGFHMAAEGIDA